MIATVLRAGANDFLLLPMRRPIFATRWRGSKKRRGGIRRGESRLGKIYTFLGTKGGVGTTALAVNFASVLAQRKHLDRAARPGRDRQRRLHATGRAAAVHADGGRARTCRAWIRRCSKASSRAIRWASSWLVRRTTSSSAVIFSATRMFREFATFLVEKYESIVIDGGRAISDETVLAARCRSSSAVFLVVRPGISGHPECAALSRVPDADGLQPGSDQDCGQPSTQKGRGPHHATRRADPADAQSAGLLRHSADAGDGRVDQQSAAARGGPQSCAGVWIKHSAPLWTKLPGKKPTATAVAK